MVEQEDERIRPRVIALVGLGVVTVTAVLVGVAWLFVVPSPPETQPNHASTLEHGLFDCTDGGADRDAGGVHRLDVYRWVDRPAHLARIPIDRAIDAVVADPRLLDAPGAQP